MRATIGLLLWAIALVAAPAAALAQSPSSDTPTDLALLEAVYASPGATFGPVATTLPAPHSDLTSAAIGEVFAPPPADTGSARLAPVIPVPGQGLAVWSVRETVFTSNANGSVDSVRVSTGGLARAPGGVLLAGPGGLLPTDNQAFDVSYIRGWPAAWSLSAGGYALDVSPHAGIGVSNGGGSAEAGAMVRVGADLQDKVMTGLDKLGMRTVSSDTLRDTGRWYLFAAASGREVGLNMGRDAQGQLQRLGWSAEGASALISDAQAGVGWRKGDMQASFGYVHREIHEQMASNVGPGSLRDSMVAFSLSLHPH